MLRPCEQILNLSSYFFFLDYKLLSFLSLIIF